MAEKILRRIAEGSAMPEALKTVARWTFGVASEVCFGGWSELGDVDPTKHSSKEYPRFRREIIDALYYGQETSDDQRDPVGRLSDRQAAVVELTAKVFFLARKEASGTDFKKLGKEFIVEMAERCCDSEIAPLLGRVCLISANDPIFVELLRDAHEIQRRHSTLIMGLRDAFLEEISGEKFRHLNGRETWHLVERIQQILDDWEETRRLSEDGGVEEPVTSNAPVHVNSPSLQLRGAGY